MLSLCKGRTEGNLCSLLVSITAGREILNNGYVSVMYYKHVTKEDSIILPKNSSFNFNFGLEETRNLLMENFHF